jgi:uncharacterized membrane protein
MDVWQLVLYVHVLAMAFFVGGQLVVAAAVVPVLRAEADGEPMRAIGRRFGWGSLVALGMLLATGVAMASHYSLWASSTLQLKLVFVAAVTVLAAMHTRFARVAWLHAAVLLCSLAIVWLGVELIS